MIVVHCTFRLSITRMTATHLYVIQIISHWDKSFLWEIILFLLLTVIVIIAQPFRKQKSVREKKLSNLQHIYQDLNLLTCQIFIGSLASSIGIYWILKLKLISKYK